ncbi:hypothetical protein [Dyadobacter sp. CY326]|uniref:hypothetical protein n=1 Tax=Dyadobacter sp. CY326 TaxID=2907300 RepID=UPI001F1759AB|nr:hypothetical protein [Dyadobacter sp. CY326]MCE7068474.1 hypothetical protein [Dyadobacter sp. CY326]
MNVQFLTDEHGERTHVLLPIKVWKKMQKDLQKQKFKDSITSGLREVKLMEEGKIAEPSIEELFK